MEEREIAIKEAVNSKDDNIEEEEGKRIQEALSWAEEEERKELEELERQKQQEQDEAEESEGPSPEEQEWMQKHLNEQMEKMKQRYGDDLYDDIIGDGEE